MAENDARLAVLIDADNSTGTQAPAILAELAAYGRPTVKRAYGDWTTSRLSAWKTHLHKLAITPVQQFAYTTGKNATDSALIIDAMDLLYSGDVDGFCIVSSDSDFTRLCTRLREDGKTVYGIGRKTTPEAFRAACDKFIFVEVLDASSRESQDEEAEEAAAEEQPPAGPTRAKKSDKSAEKPDIQLRQILKPAITRTAKENGWSSLAEVGSYIGKNHPDFDARNFGFSRLSDLMRDLDYVELQEPAEGDRTAQMWVRLRGGRRKR